MEAADGAAILDSLEGPPVARLVCPTDVPFFQRQKKIVLENSGVIDPERIEDYIAANGYTRADQSAHRDDLARSDRPGDEERLARPRRRGISHGTEVEHGIEVGGHAEVCHLQCRRRRSRRVHGSQRARKRSASRARRHADRRLCRGRVGRLHLRARRISAGHQAPAQRDPAGRAGRPARRRTSAARASVFAWICAWAPEPSSAAKRRP